MSVTLKRKLNKAAISDGGFTASYLEELCEEGLEYIEQLEDRVKELEAENSKIKEALTDRAIHIEGINLIKAGE